MTAASIPASAVAFPRTNTRATAAFDGHPHGSGLSVYEDVNACGSGTVVGK